MSASAGKRRFARIDRLPPYVFNITAELKMAARRRGEDIIDTSMGNPDGATPAHIVAKLNEAIAKIVATPEMHKYFASQGVEAMPMTAPVFGNFIKSEVDKWGKAAKAAGARVE